jgi:ubiquinone biosynthesis UbiH/UbiF/VisC/COQ6 family hydroxylase
MTSPNDADLIIIGAGPAGLSLAAALSSLPLRIALVDRAPLASLADPAFDGREIALTPASVRRLRECGAWAHIPETDVAPMLHAHVLDRQSAFTLRFGNPRPGEPLGFMVPNHAIRRALFETVSAQANCEIIADTAAVSLHTDEDEAQVHLDNGRSLRARLAVAADTRFSALRKTVGIGASMTDFGRSMLVCRVTHSRPHGGIATEWFGEAQTVAMLPLREGLSSYVLTLPAREIEPLLSMTPADFAADAQARTQERWGQLELASTRHAYPLVAVYADTFAGRRFALVGDAAVGMHPVTAHGYNLGLAGACTLATLLREAASRGVDIGTDHLLQRYARTHRRATWPMFVMTNAVAKLYTDPTPLARIARASSLRLMQGAVPIRRAIEARLSAA